MVETITIVGSLAANESATIRPETTGLVREIFFKEGQRVKKDEVLLKIDDSELRAQLEQAENADRVAQTNLGRYRELLTSGTATQAEYDRFNSEATAARSSLNVLRVRLARTEVKAPFDGVVNARTLSPGDNISTQTVITTIDDLSRLKIDFQVGERYLAKVKPGAPFKVQSGITGDKVEASGAVYFVNASIDRATRSVQVKGLLDSPPPQLRPGMFATVELVLEVRKGALTVPEGAILALPEGTQVIAVRQRGADHIVEMIPVVRGLRERGLAEITAVSDNLAEGDTIVAAGVGSLQLYSGGRVIPRPIKNEFSIDKGN